jgi:hypothetical protein
MDGRRPAPKNKRFSIGQYVNGLFSETLPHSPDFSSPEPGNLPESSSSARRRWTLIRKPRRPSTLFRSVRSFRNQRPWSDPLPRYSITCPPDHAPSPPAETPISYSSSYTSRSPTPILEPRESYLDQTGQGYVTTFYLEHSPTGATPDVRPGPAKFDLRHRDNGTGKAGTDHSRTLSRDFTPTTPGSHTSQSRDATTRSSEFSDGSFDLDQPPATNASFLSSGNTTLPITPLLQSIYQENAQQLDRANTERFDTNYAYTIYLQVPEELDSKQVHDQGNSERHPG